MTLSDKPQAHPSVQDVALIVGGSLDKPVLETLEETYGVRRYACDASEPKAVELLFQNVVRDLGTPTLLVHNIDGRVAGIFRKGISEADPAMAFETIRNSAFSAFLVAQQAARLMQALRSKDSQ